MRRFQILTLVSLAFAWPAIGQLSSQGGPIRINSDRAEIYERKRSVIFVNAVKVAQSDASLECNRMVVNYAAKADNAPADDAPLDASFGELDNLVCTGDVFYQNTDIKAQGSQATYDRTSDTIRLEGDVVLLRGDDVARGELLILEVSAGRSRLSGGGNGRIRNILNPDEIMNAPEELSEGTGNSQ